jgi:predicted N-formylglutamate amidohydrolase
MTLPLIGDDDLPAYTILNPNGRSRCILTCEHAGVAVPACLNKLGLEDEDYTRHYAVDVGMARVTATLSNLLDAPAILGNYSRLVVDLNRDISAPTAFAVQGEGKPIPGNLTMSDADRAARIREIYDPYERALSAMLDRAEAQEHPPVVISMHSFTRQFYNYTRPWQVGFLWTHDSRLSYAMMPYFRAKGMEVGDNLPYDHRILRGSTINRHADTRRLSNTLVEIRNDLILNDIAADEWAGWIADSLQEVLANAQICAYYDGPLTEYDPVRERTYYEELIEKSKRGECYG